MKANEKPKYLPLFCFSQQSVWKGATKIMETAHYLESASEYLLI